MKRSKPRLPPLIHVGHAEPKPDACPCEWCRRPAAWEFTMPGAGRPIRACNDLCAKKALRLAERQQGVVAGQGPTAFEATTGLQSGLAAFFEGGTAKPRNRYKRGRRDE